MCLSAGVLRERQVTTQSPMSAKTVGSNKEEPHRETGALKENIRVTQDIHEWSRHLRGGQHTATAMATATLALHGGSLPFPFKI